MKMTCTQAESGSPIADIIRKMEISETAVERGLEAGNDGLAYSGSC
jgi:hypothetical protein